MSEELLVATLNDLHGQAAKSGDRAMNSMGDASAARKAD
jgi:hypothetical protein